MKQILLFFLLLSSSAFAQHNDVISCRGAIIVATASPSTVTMTCQRADTLTSTICTTHSFNPVKIPPYSCIFRRKLLSLPTTNKVSIMAATVFNDAQLEVLRMMSVFNTPEAVMDLKQSISNYFAQKAESEIDRLWADGTLTESKVEEFRTLHERTPYK